MAYIETALVSSAGKLLIRLDDGTIIDAGYVKGQKGDPAGHRRTADGQLLVSLARRVILEQMARNGTRV